MKRFVYFTSGFLIIQLFAVACGPSKKGGAESPEKLFELAKGLDRNEFTEMSKFIAPDEKVVVAFSIDFLAGFMTHFSKDSKFREEYLGIRKKHKLPEIHSKNAKVNLREAESLLKYAGETYGGIDIDLFIKEMQALIEKMPGREKVKKAGYAELKDLKIEGDKASATAILENKKSEKVYFRKVKGNWYFSIKGKYSKD